MSRLFAVVLAAGSSRRFGSRKQAALLSGESLLDRTIQSITAVLPHGDVCLVLAEDAPEIHQVEQSGIRVVRNALAHTGMASSIRAGVATLPEDADAAMLLLADQPLIDARDLEGLIAHWRDRPEACVAAAYCGNVGVPAIFPRSMFDALLQLEGDRGARPLLSGESAANVIAVPLPHAAFDVDTPADLAALQGRQA